MKNSKNINNTWGKYGEKKQGMDKSYKQVNLEKEEEKEDEEDKDK